MTIKSQRINYKDYSCKKSGHRIGTRSEDVIDNKEPSTILISPNPVRDLLTLELAEIVTMVTVFNMQNQVVLNSEISSQEQKITISTATLKPGLYILRLSSKDKNIKQIKFIKE